jgi:hypothetical protein
MADGANGDMQNLSGHMSALRHKVLINAKGSALYSFFNQ